MYIHYIIYIIYFLIRSYTYIYVYTFLLQKERIFNSIKRKIDRVRKKNNVEAQKRETKKIAMKVSEYTEYTEYSSNRMMEKPANVHHK